MILHSVEEAVKSSSSHLRGPTPCEYTGVVAQLVWDQVATLVTRHVLRPSMTGAALYPGDQGFDNSQQAPQHKSKAPKERTANCSCKASNVDAMLVIIASRSSPSIRTIVELPLFEKLQQWLLQRIHLLTESYNRTPTPVNQLFLERPESPCVELSEAVTEACRNNSVAR